jgi:hypothetical protein
VFNVINKVSEEHKLSAENKAKNLTTSQMNETAMVSESGEVYKRDPADILTKIDKK